MFPYWFMVPAMFASESETEARILKIYRISLEYKCWCMYCIVATGQGHKPYSLHTHCIGVCNLYYIVIFINIWFAIWRLNKYILYAKGLSKGMQATQSVKWNECTNEKMTWNTQDMNLSWYVPNANVDHTISGWRTAISTLDHSATTTNDYTAAHPCTWSILNTCIFKCWSVKLRKRGRGNLIV